MLYIPSPLKRCTKCGEYKPATETEFYIDRTHKDWLSSQCRPCRREASGRYYKKNPKEVYEAARRWKQANPDKVRESNKRRREKNPDKVREESRRYYRKNADKVCEASKRWQKKNPDKVREADKRYREANPDKVRAHHHKRNAKKRELPATFTAEHWRYALDYFNGRCAYCGHGVGLFDQYYTLQQDHFIPVTRGGGYTPDNIIPACQSCNVRKNDSEPSKWITQRFGPRRAKIILARIATYFQSIATTH